MLTVDISNIWGSLSLSDLLESEQEIFRAHNRLMNGESFGSDWQGWQSVPKQSERCLPDVQAAAEAICGHSSALVVIGTDGASLAAQASIDLLCGSRHNLLPGGRPQIFFAGESLSSASWQSLLRILSNTDFSVQLVSWSGDDLEVLLAARSLRWMLERKYGDEKAQQHIFVSTARPNGTLERMAAEEGWQRMPLRSDVPPLFSALTPAGLLPLAVAGLDIEKMLRSAKAAVESLEIRSFENPAWLYAVSRYLLRRDGKRMELLASGDPDSCALTRWWSQLLSVGVGADGILPLPVLWSRDLPGSGEAAMGGHAQTFETLLRFAPEVLPFPVESDWKGLDGLGALEGKPLAALQETMLQTVLEQHVDAGTPAVTIDCEALSAPVLGELLYFLQLSAALYGYLCDENPFEPTGFATIRQATRAAFGVL